MSVIRSNALTITFFAVLVGNAILAHGSSFGDNWLHISTTPWLWQAETDTADKRLLNSAVQATCRPELANQINVVAVEYPRLNANSSNFYAEKDQYRTFYRCYYMGLGYAEKDVRRALEKLTAIAPPYILTVAPERQAPADFANMISKSVAEFVAKDPRYAVVPGSLSIESSNSRREGAKHLPLGAFKVTGMP